MPLFGTNQHKFSIDLEVLHDAALLVDHKGTIQHCNGAFMRQVGWRRDELVNESVHQLIPTRIIAKKAHDQKMAGYKYGSKSNFIGYDKILPIKDNKETETMFLVQIVPVQKDKSLSFLALFKVITFDQLVINRHSLLLEIKEGLAKLPKDYIFREYLPQKDEVPVLQLCKEYIQGDLMMLSQLISANYAIPSIMDYVIDLIINPPNKNLKSLKDLITRRIDNPFAFINIVCLRLLFPLLFVNHPTLRTPLKEIFEKIYKKLNNEQTEIEMPEFSFKTSSSDDDVL